MKDAEAFDVWYERVGRFHLAGDSVKGAMKKAYEAALQRRSESKAEVRQGFEKAWLIERDGPEYYDGHDWMRNPAKAIRFYRQDGDVAGLIALRALDGFGGGAKKNPRIVEHLFDYSTASPPNVEALLREALPHIRNLANLADSLPIDAFADRIEAALQGAGHE